MSVPNTVRSQGGPWDVVYSTTSGGMMGFITDGPAMRRQVSNVAPRIRVGGDAAYSDEAFDQLVIDALHHGQDLERFASGEARIQWQDGGIGLHIEGRVTLASRWNTADASVTATARRIVDFVTGNGSYICVAASTKLRIYDDALGAWSDEAPTGGTFVGTAKHLFSNDQYLFVACGTSANFWRWDGTKTTGWSQPGAGFKADAFGWYKSTLYRALGNEIFPATNNDGSAWGTAVKVGWPSTSITDIYEAAGYLFIAKPEGLFLFDGSSVHRLIDATETRSTHNFSGGVGWQGALYVPWLNALHKVVVTSQTQSTVADITPRMNGDDGKERYGHGVPWVVFAGPRRLYVATRDGEGQYPELLAYNGVGYHQVFRGASGATLYAAGYSRLKGWLLVNDGTTRFKRVINTGDGEYAEYVSSGRFWTPKIDGGYPDELKAFRSVQIDAEDVDSTQTISVKYRADGGDWMPVGTVSLEGKTELLLGGLSGQVSAREIEFEFMLTRDPDDASRTPKIKLPIVIRLLPSPAAVDAFAETLVIDERATLRNGYGRVGDQAGLTVQRMLEFLDYLADTSDTIVRVDEWGRRFRVKITDKGEDAFRGAEGGDRHLRVALRMLEMFSGVTFFIGAVLIASLSASITLIENSANVYGQQRFGLGIYGTW